VTVKKERTVVCLDVLADALANRVCVCVAYCTACETDWCYGMFCINGRAFDDEGCVICDCYRPCEASFVPFSSITANRSNLSLQRSAAAIRNKS